MNPEIFTDTVLVWLGPLPITRTMLTSLVTSLVVIACAALLARAVRREPETQLAAAGRLAYGFVHDLVHQSTGRSTVVLEAFAMGLFAFIGTSTLIGLLPGIPAPTSNLAATSALALIVFLSVWIAGIRARGPLGFLRQYLRPNPLLFPLELISELSRTIALALRLFGNMMSGHLVVALIVALTGILVPIPLMALDLLIGLLQAYIFTVLACVYIGAAIQVGEEA